MGDLASIMLAKVRAEARIAAATETLRDSADAFIRRRAYKWLEEASAELKAAEDAYAAVASVD